MSYEFGSERGRDRDDGMQPGYPVAMGIGIAFLIAAYAAPIVYSIQWPKHGIDGAYTIGAMSGALIPLFGIIVFATRSMKKVRDVLVLILGVLACAWSVLNCYRAWEDTRDLRNSVHNLEHIVDSITDKGGQATGTPPAAAPAGQTRTTVAGENGDVAQVMNAMAQVIKEFGVQVQAVQAKAALPEYQLDTVLAPDVFASPARLADSRQRLVRFKELIVTRQKACDDYIRKAEDVIKNADTSQKNRDDMMKGFNESRPRVVNGFKQLSDAQYHILQASSDLLDLAERGMGKNQVKGNRIVFANAADVATYNEGVARVQRYAQDETAAMQALQSQSGEARKKLSELAQ